MKFITSIFTAAALLTTLVSAGNNGFSNPAPGEKIYAGKPYLIKWTADTPGPVKIDLGKGSSKNIENKGQIVMLEFNWGNYTWDCPADTPAGDDYAFIITWGAKPGDGDINYTGLFSIVSDVSDDASTTSSSDASTTTSDASTTTSSEDNTKTSSAEAETETTTHTNSHNYNVTVTTSTPTSTEEPSEETDAPSKNSTIKTSPPVPTKSDSAASSFGASVGVAAVVAVAAALF